ncbi:tyrosine-type recombinase/integrase [Entomomonas asaccharolytica]|uniref:Integrase arm-type DNA-binding domain-containing protein n=1 Tax=Entomomonas asaccharolytica TaxID=2785331 RepID=A0A974RY26_9GAMM|nr:integrase arm-type DNA-binding domain-containing protein [Entomomonas asaccharolytica]QQP85474.1 integrase arm-type DNA-binding domain-containing protein [Entomomonas asaccharolytica]
MARLITPLTDTKINNTKVDNKKYLKLFDGGGLFLSIAPSGSKVWKIKYNKPDGRESLITVGDYPSTSLKDARAKREEIKGLLAKGIDPFQEKQKVKLVTDNKNTFEPLAREWLKQTADSKKWKPVHTAKMTRIIENYILDSLGKRDITTITFTDLMQPIQKAMKQQYFDVAKTVRQTLVKIMRLAVIRGIITINPALDLVGLDIERKADHRPALNIDRLQELAERLYSYPHYPVTKYALLITLHTFVRSSELRFARWDEIDFTNKVWIIPETREAIEGVRFADRGAKMMTAHIVPLSEQVVTLLTELKEITGNYDLIFTYNGIKPISENAINEALRKVGYDTKTEICGHGFRSLACSALIESGLFSEDAIERQMSHLERNNVRAAYIHKAKHLEERINIMQWWSNYIIYNRDHGYIAPYNFNITK